MLAGYLYLLVAVFAWSSYPVRTKIAYGVGLTPLALGFLRFGLALPVLLLACVGLYRRSLRALLRDRSLGWSVPAQGMAFAGAALTSFYAVEMMPASLATILLYLSPALTSLLAAAFAPCPGAGGPLAGRAAPPRAGAGSDPGGGRCAHPGPGGLLSLSSALLSRCGATPYHGNRRSGSGTGDGRGTGSPGDRAAFDRGIPFA